MSESRAPRGSEWTDVVEVLHRFQNVMATRAHYPAGHPAIQRAATGAADGFARVLPNLSELVVNLTDGELVLYDRPMPDLRESMSTFATALERHEIDCVVFMRGLELAEIEHLALALAGPADLPGRVRDRAQAKLAHVLLRYSDVRGNDKDGGGEVHAATFMSAVTRLHDHVLQAFSTQQLADVAQIRALARRVVNACAGRRYTLLTRCYVPGSNDQAPHAINVAMMTAGLAIAGHIPDDLVVDVTAAALLHDIGTLLSPAAIRGMPEPALDEPQRNVFRHHPLTGAWALLATGCPPLWVAVALEHHRGVDGGGYPLLETGEPPSELVRMVSLASFFDRKRTLLDGHVDDPDAALQQAARLEAKYFGPPLVTRFLRTFGVYPPGTIVELTDRNAAVVTHASAQDPVRPLVRLLTGPNAGRQVDLKHRNVIEGRHDLSIARAILAPLARRDPHEKTASEAPAEPGAPPDDDIAAAEPGAPPDDDIAAAEPGAPPDDDIAARPRRSSDELLALLGGTAAIPELARADLAPVSLDHRQAFLLTFIDGETPVDLLLVMTGLPEHDILEILDDLVMAGVVRMRC
jgi:hypothetical protein